MITILDGNAFYLRITGKTKVGEYEATLDLEAIDSLIVNFVRRVRESQTVTHDQGKVLAYNDGKLAKGVYGVEMVGYYNGQPWRFYAPEVFEIADGGETEADNVIGSVNVYDVTFYMKLGGDGVTPGYVDAAVTMHNTSEDAHSDMREAITGLRTKVEGRITDVVVVGRDGSETSMSEYNDQGNKVVKLPQDSMGKVDGVKVNGEELEVDANGKVDITIPTTVHDLDPEDEYATKEDAQAMVDEAKVTGASVDYQEDGGSPSATVNFNEGSLDFTLRNMKMKFSELTNDEKEELRGPQGIPGEGAIWTGSGEEIMTLAQETGQAINKSMSQKAVTDEVTTDEIVKTFYGADVTKGTGFVSNQGGFTVSNVYVGGFIPISQYVGKKVRLYLGNGELIRYAFTKSAPTSNTTTSILCQGCELVSIRGAEYTDDIVPSDAVYFYVFLIGNDVNMYPSKIDVMENKSIKSVMSETDEYVEERLRIVDFSSQESELESLLDIVTGIILPTGLFVVSTTGYKGSWLNVSEHRGKTIRLLSSEQNEAGHVLRYAFTKSAPSTYTSTSVLCQGTSLKSYFYAHSKQYVEDIIPDDCNYLYVYYYDKRYGNCCPSEITILSRVDDNVISNKQKIAELQKQENVTKARLFGFYFPNNETIDGLNGINEATIASDGMTLTVLSPVTLPKLTVFDDEEFTLEVKASASDKVLFYSAYTKTGELTSAAQSSSHVLFDFANGRISIYQAETINAQTGLGTELVGADFVSGTGTYVISIGRKQREVFAAVYDKSTKNRVEVLAVEKDYPSVNIPKRPAGWLYKYPSFMTLAGTPKYVRFNGYTDSSLYMLFQGDSYTEGYAGYYPNAWSRNACKYFRNSRTCGISGHKLDDMVQQYHESIKDKVKTEVMVISIGINDMRDDLTSDALINAWGERFKAYLDELVADGIIPIVNRIWPEGSSTSSTATKAAKINKIIRSFGYDGADFGAVTGYYTSSYYTEGHLSDSGNRLTYEIFINELNQYKR